MSILVAEGLSKAYSERILLDGVGFGIEPNDKIGIIGLNGAGKTTLLKILAGIETPDLGRIIKTNQATVGYLPQDIETLGNTTVLDQIFSGHSKKLKIVKAYYEALNHPHPDSENIVRLSAEMDFQNAWDIENDAKVILQKLGLFDLKQPLDALSGGQRKRVALAAALIDPCDVLILDEPTNHLDNLTIEWLELYLKNRKGALIMITHDRYFLDRVVNRMFELHRGKLYTYTGNYNAYLEKKAERELIEQAEESKRQNLYRNELAWIRRGAQARSTKQKARIDRFNTLSQTLGLDNNLSMEISVGTTRLGRKILEIEGLSKRYPSCNIVTDFNYVAARGERVGVIGENGVGKSSFVYMLTGSVKPDSGVIAWGETVKLGYFAQEPQDLDPVMRAIDFVKLGGEYVETGDGEKITAGQMMEKFLFDKTLQWTPIGKLSGGEKRRLSLLRVLMEAPNVLIFDEPTNDLDIQTLTVLEAYLDAFDGVVYVVSHDRYMLDKVVDKLLVFEGDGKVAEITGSYSDYLESVVNTALLKEPAKDKAAKPSMAKKTREKVKFTYSEQREWENIESEIAALEHQLEALEIQIESTTSDYLALEALGAEKSQLEAQLENKMERWMVLNDMAEQLNM